MTDPIRNELQSSLHTVTLGEGVSCDYHQRPKELSLDDGVLAERIRIVDHPQLINVPEGWVVDAVRCSKHALSEIEHPTRGYEEAVVRVPVTKSNGIVSIDTPMPDTIEVLAFESATNGLSPLMLDQQLLAASESEDVGLSRWVRVQGMVAADPPDELREHVERLIEESPETPSSFE